MALIGSLLAISDRRQVGAAGLVAWARRLAGAGVGAIQLREKDLSDLEILDLATRLRDAFPPPGRLLVNGRFDIALAADADGVHLPASGLPAAAVRRAVPAGFLVGCSTHDLDELSVARRAGADYATFGPVFPTPGKEGLATRGLDGLRRAARLGLPLFALGGITSAEAIHQVARAGAAGVAGIRLFADEGRLVEAVAAAREAFGGEP